MSDKEDQELKKLLEGQGVKWDEAMEGYKQKHPESEHSNLFGGGGMPGPAAVIALALDAGFSIPWSKALQFLLCVLQGIWSKSLPLAAAECAKKWGEPVAAQK
jgi:hypothetical protein